MKDKPIISVVPEVAVSTIADEDQFQDAIIAAKEKLGKTDGHMRFEGLAQEIHTALSRQDSESTLKLITE